MAITRLAWVLTVVALATTAFASAQTIPELAKARPANPVVRGILQDIPASSIDELTKGAAIVAEGVISHERSYLTPDEQHIQTDFQIIPSRVIAARLQVARSTPGQPPPLTLAVTGGKYTVDGFTVYEVDHNRENLKVGGRYLLFLKPSRQAGKYQLYAVGAFEIDNDKQRLRPLLRRSEGAYFVNRESAFICGSAQSRDLRESASICGSV